MELFLDIYLGILVVNAFPHLIVGQLNIRFLSLFGYSSKANIAYSLFNVFGAVAIALYKFGLDTVFSSGFTWGALFVYVSFFIGGPFLFNYWHFSYNQKK